MYVAVLPHPSVALHDLVTILLNACCAVHSNELSVDPVEVTVGVLHASEAVGVADVGTAS